jgi:hypothetical protein
MEWVAKIIAFFLGLFTRSQDLEERVDNLKARIEEDTKAREEEDPMKALREEFPRQ